MWLPYNGIVAWMEHDSYGIRIFRPTEVPEGVTIAFSGRGRAPENETTPTAFLARRFAKAVGLVEAPIHWAKQVHGNAATTVREPGSAAASVNVGEGERPATD